MFIIVSYRLSRHAPNIGSNTNDELTSAAKSSLDTTDEKNADIGVKDESKGDIGERNVEESGGSGDSGGGGADVIITESNAIEPGDRWNVDDIRSLSDERLSLLHRKALFLLRAEFRPQLLNKTGLDYLCMCRWRDNVHLELARRRARLPSASGDPSPSAAAASSSSDRALKRAADFGSDPYLSHKQKVWKMNRHGRWDHDLLNTYTSQKLAQSIDQAHRYLKPENQHKLQEQTGLSVEGMREWLTAATADLSARGERGFSELNRQSRSLMKMYRVFQHLQQ